MALTLERDAPIVDELRKFVEADQKEQAKGKEDEATADGFGWGD